MTIAMTTSHEDSGRGFVEIERIQGYAIGTFRNHVYILDENGLLDWPQFSDDAADIVFGFPQPVPAEVARRVRLSCADPRQRNTRRADSTQDFKMRPPAIPSLHRHATSNT